MPERIDKSFLRIVDMLDGGLHAAADGAQATQAATTALTCPSRAAEPLHQGLTP